MAQKASELVVTVSDRIQLISWINDRFGGVAKIAEIGVLRGEYAEHILKLIRNPTLTLVDNWDPANNSPYFMENPEELVSGEALVHRKFDGNPNVGIIKNDSVGAAKLIPDCSLDWVYIDANHAYEAVMADIRAWYPKVKIGGVISGHDFKPDKSNPDCKTFGIDKAVKKVFGKDFFLTGEETYKSWFHVKKALDFPTKE